MIRNRNMMLCWMCHLLGLGVAALAMSFACGSVAFADEPESKPDLVPQSEPAPQPKPMPAAEPAPNPHHDHGPQITPAGPTAFMPVDEFSKPASWSIPTVEETRKNLVKWLEEMKKADKPTLSKELEDQILAQWPTEEKSLDATAQLDRLAGGIALLDKRYQTLVDQCRTHRSEQTVPRFDWLFDEKIPTFVRNNLRLYYGRWLSQERYFEESMVMLEKMQPVAVVDPVTLLFYQSVNHHALLNKNEGMKSLAIMFERPSDLPRRYELLGRMMEVDLRGLKEDSLDHISRRMKIIKDWMEFGRSGKKTQGEEQKVIAALDKIIEEMEKQKNGEGGGGGSGGGQGGNGGGPPNGIQSSGPAGDSSVARGKGAGDNARKNIGTKSGWGDLPPKEREEALQQISKDFPSHYREIVEEYFRRRAESE